MLPSVNQKRRSNSKGSFDLNSSPYSQIFSRSTNFKLRTCFKKNSPSMSKTSLFDVQLETPKMKEFKKQDLEEKPRPARSEDFEKVLTDRLESLNRGDSEFSSEMEVIDNVFDEVSSLLKPFEKVLNLLRRKIKEACYAYAKEDYAEKIEKLVKEKNCLVLKINGLSDINKKLVEENKVFEVKVKEFEKLFNENPEVLLSYQNIVNKMLEQCQNMEELKKENKKLKKIEEFYYELVREINESGFADKSLIEDHCAILREKYNNGY